MSIHKHISDRVGLARVYAKDGAFRTAARILRDLAGEIDGHADHCDAMLAEFLAGHADPVNLQGSGPAPIAPREG